MSLPWDGIATLLDTVITRVFPDKTEAQRAELQVALEQMKAEYAAAAGQMEINKIEAASSDRFVSGWRPFIGWVCGVAICYSAIIEPMLRFFMKVHYGYEGEFPIIDTTLTQQLLFGILGLGTMRTYEKYKGVN